VANYVEAVSLVIENGSVKGVEAQDRMARNRLRINARWVINAAGPWLNALIQERTQADPLPIRWTRGINLVIDRPLFSGYGLGLGGRPLKDKSGQTEKRQRLFFFVPWKGCTLVGTAYRRYDGKPGQDRIELEDLRSFLDELNAVYPHGNLNLKDVSFFHSGLLPLSEGQDPADFQAEPDRHFRLFDHESQMRLQGFISIKGTKYTTAPVVAEKIMELLSLKENNPPPRKDNNGGDSSLSPSSLIKDLAPIKPEASPADLERMARHLYENYGLRAQAIITCIREDPAMGFPVSNDPPVLAAEIIHGVREEMALKLSDVIFRRTDLGQVRRPSWECLQNSSRIMGQELGWNEAQRQAEIEGVLAAYGPINDIDPLPRFEPI
jgi:glycerol-3-phosphate dehydrogenase